MAKKPPAEEENGKDKSAAGQAAAGQAAASQGAPGQAATGQAGPSLSALAQYIKDFSFENPNSPNSLRPRESSPNISININVAANGLSQTDYEVVLKLDAKAVSGEEVLFNVELLYGGIFRIQNVPEDALRAALFVECPRLLFPFARQIIGEATRNGGFPPLMIDPVDFVGLFQSKLAEEKAAGGAATN